MESELQNMYGMQNKIIIVWFMYSTRYSTLLAGKRCTDKKLLEVMLRQKKERKLLDKKLLDKKLLSLISRFYDIM